MKPTIAIGDRVTATPSNDFESIPLTGTVVELLLSLGLPRACIRFDTPKIVAGIRQLKYVKIDVGSGSELP